MTYDKFKYINRHHSELINGFGDVEGVKELADEIRGLYGSELYEKFFKTFIFHNKHNDSEK